VFDFVNRKKHVVQVIMGLAVLPFLFWGVESYRSDGKEGYVAVVDGEEIPRREFEQALRDHHERMRGMLGTNFDSAMLDSFEVKNSVLERLIQQRLLQKEAISNGFLVLDSQLVKTIREIPAFQKDSKFSKQQYEELLRSQGLTPIIFESRVRQELLLQQLLDGYSEHGFAPRTVAERVRYLSEVQREINQIQIESEQFLSQVTPEEADINHYYEKHKVDFHLPERARIEYLVLSLEATAANETVSEESISKYYEEHQNEFSQPEERKASHILISVSAAASEDEKKNARNKAENILEMLKQNPDAFAEIAKEHSDDPGSAIQGGDLGFFGRGVMVKAFEEKIFSMQLEEISDIVGTDFGLHIIKLTDVKEVKRSDLTDVREQIEKKLKIEMMSSSFGEIVEDFSNLVYEQGDNLQAAAEKLELTIQSTDWITRNSVEPSILANEKLLSVLFSDESIKNQRNTEAIEVKPDTFVSARILEHKPATAQSLMVVKDQIVEKLKKQMAQARAIEEGQEKLVHLQETGESDGDNSSWGDAKQISYMQLQGLDHETLGAIFKAETSNLPAYIGSINPEGDFNLIRINKVIEPEPIEKIKLDNFGKQLQQMITQEEMSSYLTMLRKRYEVRVKQDNF
jgi:peptidyl-prolyl cis-trans isomerase D